MIIENDQNSKYGEACIFKGKTTYIGGFSRVWRKKKK